MKTVPPVVERGFLALSATATTTATTRCTVVARPDAPRKTLSTATTSFAEFPMSNEPNQDQDQNSFDQFVESYAGIRPRYEECTRALDNILTQASRIFTPHALVQVRTKAIPSFAEKILRKGYTDPFRQMTDLSGARVIVHSRAEVKALCDFIEDHFRVDKENSLDWAKRRGTREFGYRSVHYVVQFRDGAFPTNCIRFEPSPDLFDLKSEIQVRTLAEHCWADIGHDRMYKSAFTVPDRWEREVARISALLESVDEAFARVLAGLAAYRASYGGLTTRAQVEQEYKILRTVLRKDAGNEELAHRCARLAICLEKWEEVRDIAQPFQPSGSPRLRLCASMAQCLKHRDRPTGAEYLAGQNGLELAAAADPKNVEVLLEAANALIGDDMPCNRRAETLYERAFDLDPSNPRALVGFAQSKIIVEYSRSVLELLKPLLENALARCQEQIDVKVNLPWALYHLGELNLLLRRPYEALAAYLKAAHLTFAEFILDEALATVKRLKDFGPKDLNIPGLEWVRRLLLVVKAVRFRGKDSAGGDQRLPERLQTLTSPEQRTQPLVQPVRIVAGGCDPSVETEVQRYLSLLEEALAGFKGTVISGGTREGISGLVGTIRHNEEERGNHGLRCVGYLPAAVRGANRNPERYELREAEGEVGFSPLQPLQHWIDILHSGIEPGRVKLFGIGGGPIAAFEYRLALALGGEVAILKDSGREADALLADPDWNTAKNLRGLTQLSTDDLRQFLADRRETLARLFHEAYVANEKARLAEPRPNLADWDNLSPEYREANIEQAFRIESKLNHLDITVHAVSHRPIRPFTFTDEEIEALAREEHERWMEAKKRNGWSYGPEREEGRKIHPSLVPWEQLGKEDREKNRVAIRLIPKLLEDCRLELQRRPASGSGNE
jgi:ppGpp synthetase/RelA/SpoT-type nucleotidyltranferase